MYKRQGFSSALLRRAAGMDSLADVCSDIKNALLDKPNISLTEGNLCLLYTSR